MLRLRRLPILVVGTIVVIAALSTGLSFLFFLVYLGLLVIAGSYLTARLGLTSLEAGFAIAQVHGHVGDQLRATYTIRNVGRIPKLWLETYNPSSLPVPLPGRAISLGPRAERTWVAKVPLSRRGHFRVDPLQIRTGDPFGLFESVAGVGHGVNVVVYPRIERIPRWRLPSADLDGSHASRERALQTTPLATGIRPYAPGDSFNRIHWKSTARQGEIQVKEFDLEQTADAWIVLDLDAGVQAGKGDRSTVEVGVRAAASIAVKALEEGRAVGLTASGRHVTTLQADRGARQRLKVMQLLAAVEGDGASPLAETLIVTLPRLRRGMTAVIVTASDETDWLRPLASLRARGVACVIVLLDGPTYAVAPGRPRDADATGAVPDPDPEHAEAVQAMRALRHQLAEYDLRTVVVPADERLAEALA
jgi:uncharacterized protein (DUF58 family)